MAACTIAHASDHLDAPATVADPKADIADVYAWTSPDGRRLNLVMTVQGHSLSDTIEYVFHVDSGSAFGRTTASTSIACRFPAVDTVDCKAGGADSAQGNASSPEGLEGRNHRFRVFAGLRDDPFFNNIKGSVAAYQAANAAIARGAVVDITGCPHFDEATSKAIRDQFTHTDGGPAQNFLFNWTVSAIVISVDLGVVNKGGKLLAVWGTSTQGGKRIDRMARPFVGNTLLGSSPFSTDDSSGRVRDDYNSAVATVASAQVIENLRKSLAFQDGLDGKCGNQLLADKATTAMRYKALARMFADDRLWINSASRLCTQFFGVELAQLAGRKGLRTDCGGRTPTYNMANVWRSLLVSGSLTGFDDGLHQDEHAASATAFPFLAPPAPHAVNH